MAKMRSARHLRRSPVRMNLNEGVSDAGLRERSTGDEGWLRELDPQAERDSAPEPKGVALEPSKASAVRRGQTLESSRGSY